MKKVIIVESPSKSKTIESFLGEDYKVLSSVGHIRDLSTSGKDGLGLDIENDFNPNYVVIKDKQKVVNTLIKETKDCEVFLATDLDREGESISWHLANVLNLDIYNSKRIVFNEITKTAITEALKNPRTIDINLVSGQETRRILDRIIGFKLSTLLKNKIKVKSAGRVQSVALKLIVDLEDEIKSFVPEEYYEIEAIFDNFKALLTKYNNDKLDIKTNEEADEILSKLSKEFEVEDIKYTKKNNPSKPPFITSTLQQEASNKLNFSSVKTNRTAQSLYEGKEIHNELKGLITYMRTDSIRLSDEFVKSANKYINTNFGENYLGKVKNKKGKKIQDAHEAIRPTYIELTPDSIKPFLTSDEYKLYKLIYNRALASLMSDSVSESQRITLNNNNYKFETSASKIIFDGYKKIYMDEDEDTNKYLDLKVNDVINSNDIIKKQLFTKPKSRYNEAKLIKDLEELGIGRPSTYANIISTLKTRDYIEVIDKKFHPTEDGILTVKTLDNHFSDIINVDFTAEMEKRLDEIKDGFQERKEIISKFYNYFIPKVEDAKANMEKIAPVLLEEICPNCGSHLVERKGRFGKFIACSNYPECKYIKKEKKEVDYLDKDCPKCGHKLVRRMAKKGKNKGKFFIACSNFPKCDYAENEKKE